MPGQSADEAGTPAPRPLLARADLLVAAAGLASGAFGAVAY
ncbi:hypothetical protein B0I33_102395 [Prauserella shujinwangii]|uniref:Uncharacterized protein n=1 Tax=Prauserella shujinwangii TaxID=1453103 RepID=A0A2T0M0Z2_9PSEU|nr:hypothetical protein [Prauserella shujinwangii]PRX50276.1 hypothetical protein B0I33_102395 [Prauserella shujinwangii]